MNLAHHARAPRMRARRAYILLHNATSPYFYLIACLSRKMNSRFRTRTDYRRTAACEFVRTRRTRFARPRWRVASNIGRRCSTGKLKQEQLVGTCNPTYNKRLPLEDKFGLIRGDPATCCLVDRRQLFLRALYPSAVRYRLCCRMIFGTLFEPLSDSSYCQSFPSWPMPKKN